MPRYRRPGPQTAELGAPRSLARADVEHGAQRPAEEVFGDAEDHADLSADGVGVWTRVRGSRYHLVKYGFVVRLTIGVSRHLGRSHAVEPRSGGDGTDERGCRWARDQAGGAGFLCLLLAGACSTQRKPPETTVDLNADGPVSDETRVRVDNQNLADLTIYVYRGAQRMRLGRARGNGTTDLVIPKSMVSGATELRFQAEPLGNQRGVHVAAAHRVAGDIVDFYVQSIR